MDLLDAVYLAMPHEERASLPDDIGPYVDALVVHALGKLGEFREVLRETIARVYSESPRGERFIKDPLRSSSISRAILFLDPEGDLVSVKTPEIMWDTSIAPNQILKRYESYQVLTGGLTGRRFSWSANALGEPVFKPVPTAKVEPVGGGGRNR